MSVLTVLKAQIGTLTEGERQIAQFILDEPDRMIPLSSATLAETIGRSQSSVIKFCQKLGFSGYQDFKLAVSQAIAQSWQVPSGMVHGSIDATDSYATTVQKLVGSKLHAMQQTISVNNETVIGRALEQIQNARRVQLVGVGAASLVARDLTYKLQKLGLFVIYEADSHVQVANAATLGRSDVMIALSQSGASLETLHVAKTAKAHGSVLISITGVQPNRLSAMSDIQLYTVADEERPRSSAITSRDAQLTMTDLLFILLLQRKPEANALIHAAEDAVTGLKS